MGTLPRPSRGPLPLRFALRAGPQPRLPVLVSPRESSMPSPVRKRAASSGIR